VDDAEHKNGEDRWQEIFANISGGNRHSRGQNVVPAPLIESEVSALPATHVSGSRGGFVWPSSRAVARFRRLWLQGR
jgi:hypothetical protein